MNLPNAITLVRLGLVPVLVSLLIAGEDRWAFWTFVVAGLSDALDGALARALGQKTRLGAHLDPAADKLLLSSSFVALAFLRRVPLWLTFLVFSRDLVIAVGVLVLVLLQGEIEIRPTVLGKANTALQILTVLVVLWGEGVSPPALSMLFRATGLLALASGLQYVVRGVGLLREGRSRHASA